MGKAIIDISNEYLCDLLFLPDDTEILYATLPERAGTLRFVISSPAIPETQAEGAGIPRITPVFRRDQSPSTVTMVDWGLA